LPGVTLSNKLDAMKDRIKKLPSNYPTFLAEVKQRIRASQYAALKSVNTELVSLYWELGRMIVERQEHDGWGAAVVDKLSDDLQAEFPGQAGFSRRNLYNIRDLYKTYKDDLIVQPLVAQIGWSHNIMILEKCETAKERKFYIAMTKKFGWTKNVLATQIANNAFAHAAKAQSNFDKVLPAAKAAQAHLAIKDEYTFDFLELESEHSERELERALLGKVNQFLIEMGGMFAFVGSQYRLRVDEQDFFIDLLLYHRSLKCFVAIELKVTEFKPSYAGQMQFYLTVLNATQRLPDEGPAIGIILCREKRRIVVEYALASTSHPVGVASYVVSKDLPNKLKGQLPTEAQISRLLDATDSYLTANLEGGNPIVQPLVAQLPSSRRKAKTAKKVVKSRSIKTKRSSRK
jgi:predicted nuclease of restriction endonuclease-like (RecB) superfamily